MTEGLSVRYGCLDGCMDAGKAVDEVDAEF